MLPHRQRERLWEESSNQSDYKLLRIFAKWSENFANQFGAMSLPLTHKTLWLKS